MQSLIEGLRKVASVLFTKIPANDQKDLRTGRRRKSKVSLLKKSYRKRRKEKEQ
jgi:hypothetical protein